jgi:hypothetical protein
VKATTFVTWDDVPHLTEEQKAKILKGVPAYQRDARSKGVPQLGEGAIYQIPESEFVITPIELAAHWPRAYGLDVGWRMNAAIFMAHDRDTDTVYVYDEIYRGRVEPSTVAAAIRRRGEWIPGVIDPASRGRSQVDGRQLMQVYKDLGLDLRPAINTVEAGILEVYQRLSEGRLKVFKSCANLLAEYRIYRRDKHGRVVKSNDHALDALRYLIMSGLARAVVQPAADSNGRQWWQRYAPPAVFAG